MPSAAWREERWMNKVIWQKKHQKQGIIVKKRIYQDTVGVRLQSWVVQTASASILTFVQRGPEEDVLCMCERDEQTWPCFVLFISWPVHSNGADDVFTWRKRVTSCKVSQQKSSISELFFFLPFMGLLIDQLKRWQETGWERGGETHNKGPRARSQTSVHGTPALPSQLNDTPIVSSTCVSPVDHVPLTGKDQRGGDARLPPQNCFVTAIHPGAVYICLSLSSWYS